MWDTGLALLWSLSFSKFIGGGRQRCTCGTYGFGNTPVEILEPKVGVQVFDPRGEIWGYKSIGLAFMINVHSGGSISIVELEDSLGPYRNSHDHAWKLKIVKYA